MAEPARKILAQVKYAQFEVRYPIGLAILGLQVQDGPAQTPRDEELRLILQPEGARAIASKLLELADAMEKLAGPKQ